MLTDLEASLPSLNPHYSFISSVLIVINCLALSGSIDSILHFLLFQIILSYSSIS
nr:MAG TPA: Queuosine biosynthesis protein QueC [Caudoviricetes sp.]